MDKIESKNKLKVWKKSLDIKRIFLRSKKVKNWKKSKKKNVNNFDLSKKRTYAPSRAEEVDSPIPPMLSKSGEPVAFCDSSWDPGIKFSVPVIDGAAIVSLPRSRWKK